MTITFDTIPAGIKVPFAFVEFNASKASAGTPTQPYKLLLAGQRLSSGSVAALVPTMITSPAQGPSYFGPGSELANMIAVLFASGVFVETWAVAFDDPSGVAATGSFAFGGTPSATGTIAVYVAGRRFTASITLSSTPTTIASALVSAIQADTNCPANATSTGGTITITAKQKGTIGNEIDLRHSYNPGELLPAGVTLAISTMANGSGDVSYASLWPALGDTQYNIICAPVTDATNLTSIENEMNDRFGPIRACAGLVITASSGDITAAPALGNSRNSPHVSIFANNSMPTPTWEVAADAAAQIAASASLDPARPLRTLPLNSALPPIPHSRFTTLQQNTLLNSGMSTLYTDAGGTVRVQRAITTYKTNVLGVADPAYFDITTPLTLDRLRFDFVTYFLTKYPRHKLADDGTRFGTGQAILTPSIARAEALTLFRAWEEQGLVENVDDFKANLVVERDAKDATRLNFYLPPNLVNGLEILAAQVGFRL